MTTKLTPKMTEALDYVVSYGTAGTYSDRTLSALVSRGLIEHTDRTDAVRAGAAWGYRVTDAGRAALPITHPTVAPVVEESAEPKPTATQKLARLQAQSAKSGPCCPLWSRGIDCMCADAAEHAGEVDLDGVEGCDAGVHDGPSPEDGRECGEPVTINGRCADHPLPEKPITELHRTLLYDLIRCQAMIVLGTFENGRGLYFRYENDDPQQVRTVGVTRLRGTRFTAVCRHYHGQRGSCPGCDHDREMTDTEAQRQELIRQANTIADAIDAAKNDGDLVLLDFTGPRVATKVMTLAEYLEHADAFATKARVRLWLADRSVRVPALPVTDDGSQLC